MKYCKGLRIIKKGNVYILNNKYNGQWMKLTDEVYKWMNIAIESEMEQEAFLQQFNKNSRQYMQDIVKHLKELGIIIEKEVQEKQDGCWKYAEFAITSQCNLCCKHCCVSEMEKQRQPKKQEIIQVIDQLASCQIDELTFTGGEPLIRNDFEEIIEYAKGKFNKLYLMTNGTLITKEKALFIANHFDGVSISLDGYDPVSCESIRGKNVFEKVRQAVKALHACGVEHVSLSMVINTYTYKHDEEFIELNKKWDTTPIFRRFAPTGRGKEYADEIFETLLFHKETKQEASNCIDGQGENSSAESSITTTICNALEKKVFIGSDLHIYPCGALYMEEFCGDPILEIANLYLYMKDKLYKNTESYSKYMSILPERFSDCQSCAVNIFCNECPTYMYLYKKYGYFEQYCKAHKKQYEELIYGKN